MAVADEARGQQVETIVAGLLAKKGLGPVGRTANLREAGLSSLDMVNVMLAVEDAFDIMLPQEQMTPENFRSIETIDQLLSGLV